MEFFAFLALNLKYSYTIMYDCEKSPLTHELFYIGFSKIFTQICLM
jgi:hypothetical protein